MEMNNELTYTRTEYQLTCIWYEEIKSFLPVFVCVKTRSFANLALILGASFGWKIADSKVRGEIQYSRAIIAYIPESYLHKKRMQFDFKKSF